MTIQTWFVCTILSAVAFIESPCLECHITITHTHHAPMDSTDKYSCDNEDLMIGNTTLFDGCPDSNSHTRDYSEPSDVNCNPNIIKLFKYFCEHDDDKKLLLKLLFQSFGNEEDEDEENQPFPVISELSQTETLRQLILMLNDDTITTKLLSDSKNLDGSCVYLMKSWQNFVTFSSVFQNKDTTVQISSLFKNNPIMAACYFNKYQILDEILNFLQISNEVETMKKLMLSSLDRRKKIAIMAATSKCRITILRHYEANFSAISFIELLNKETRKHKTALIYIAEQNDVESLQFILNSSLIDTETKINLLTHECDVYLPRKDQSQASRGLPKKQTVIGHLFRKGLGIHILKYFQNDKQTLLKLLSVRNEIKRTPLLIAAATNSKILRPLLKWIFNESSFDYKQKISFLFEFDVEGKTMVKYDARNHGTHDNEDLLIIDIINYLQSQNDDKTLTDLLLSSRLVFFSESCVPKNGLNYFKKVFKTINNNQILKQILSQIKGHETLYDTARRRNNYNLEIFIKRCIDYTDFTQTFYSLNHNEKQEIDISFEQYDTNPFITACDLGKTKIIKQLFEYIKKNDDDQNNKLKTLLLNSYDKINGNDCLMTLYENEHYDIIFDI